MKKTPKEKPYEAPKGVVYTVHSQNGMCLLTSGVLDSLIMDDNESFVLDDYAGDWIEA